MKQAKNRFLLFFLINFTCISVSLQAQKLVNGKIFDSQTQEPIVGATVSNLDKTVGTVTDINGLFSLKTDDSQIFISSIGYEAIQIEAKDNIVISLTPSVQNLQDVIVTANREASLRTTAPMAISKLSSKLLDETKPTMIYEAINKTPGVLMVNLNNEQHMMAIRQPITTNAYFLYMEDGVPIRPMGVFNHNALLELNQFTVSSIEVVKGPVSSIYGAEAVGGAVNFISQRPTVVPTFKLGLQADQWGYQRVQFGGGATLGKFGFFVGGLVSRQRDSWMTNSDYDKTSLNARLEYHFNPSTRLIGTLAYGKYYSNTSGSVDSTAYYTRQYVSTTGFTYRKSDAIRSRVTLEHDWGKGGSQSFITVFSRDNKHGQNPAYAISWRTPSTTAWGQVNSNDFKSYGVIAQHTQNFKFLSSKLIVGATYDYSPNDYWAYYVQLNALLRDDKKSVIKYSIVKERPDSIRANYDAKINNSAAYAQYDFNPLSNLRISLGVRYDHMSFSYNNYLDKTSGSKDYAQVTPKVGLTYDLGNGKGLYANYSKGFSPPGLTSIFTKRPTAAADGSLFYYNLEPALFDNKEVGGWVSLLNNKLYIDVAAYQMNGTNELLNIKQPDNTTDYQSAGKTLHKGIELGLTAKPSKELFFRFGATYALHKFVEFTLSQKATDAIKDVNGKEMPSSPHWVWNTEINYYPEWLKNFRTSLEWQHVSDWYQNQVNTVKADGYNLINARVGYAWKGVEIYTNILNIGDILYSTNTTRGNLATDRTTFYPAAPRTFVMGIQYNFIGKK